MRILSGLQPTGRLHLGNYFGMMQPALQLQHEGEAFYFIADYHSLTAIQNAKVLRENVQNLAVDFLACGLDPEKAVFFRQSDVPEVTELSWILNTVTPMPMLENCHSYKDKIANGITPNSGLFTYPVLMAADILIYDSDLVPVGKDQKQHLEVTRDIAVKMNLAYGEGLLKVPKERIREEAAVVIGTDGKKMSKSYGNTIELFEEEKPFKKKFKKIETDSTPVPDPKPIEGSNILPLYRLVATPEEVATMEQEHRAGGVGYGAFKERLGDKMWDFFAEARARRADILSKPGYVEDVLQAGAAKARAVAKKTVERVRHAVGLG
ncbi:tryptophanyl-tRNA synthetase [Roseimicrobium gellanilyticum]|uniref:Tryptophan--tRNA ligase n=1 Tax=Roseimicrobium gellanilyticum TaxID=748857 RepID=A0A366H745_9BACT|nr:tryptophan--tRNA ligase [Roseimicrobium gellanilyticum]RBP37325.1 tryptophanyl-tRNA synthetase [Roseimicrobium gellanilyticum]